MEQVGRTFNITRERIRQIEINSLKKLSALADANRLRDTVRLARQVARKMDDTHTHDAIISHARVGGFDDGVPFICECADRRARPRARRRRAPESRCACAVA